jgi:hypothetical protein
MPRGIIRIPKDVVLPEPVVKTLKKWFPDYEFEYYSPSPDYQQIYTKRVDLLYQGFKFLADAYPSSLLDKEILNAYADACRTKFRNVYEIDALQVELIGFTGKLVDAIIAGWNCTGAQAAELLNEAEQYVLMAKGRIDLATLTPVKLGKEKGVSYVLQLDKTLPAYDNQLISELTEIKNSNYPKTPVWLRQFSEPKKHYVHTFLCNVKIGTQPIAIDFNDFLTNWSQLKNVRDMKIDLQCIASRSQPYPDWFNGLKESYQELITDLAGEKIEEIDRKLKQLKATLSLEVCANDLKCVTKIPQWYWVLSEHQQYFLEKLLKSNPSIEEVTSSAGSRNRSIPMLPNLGTHEFGTMTMDGELKFFYSPIIRSSHIASRDGIKNKWPQSVQNRHAHSNLRKAFEQVKKDQIILFQTLISPKPSVPLLSSIIPDFQLNKLARAVVNDGESEPPIVQINHPLNKAKLISYTVAENPDIVRFLKTITPYAEKNPFVGKILENYNKVLSSPPGTATVYEYADGLGRELFLSALEPMAVLSSDGYFYGSCVSGKDRKALAMLHMDAMYYYFFIYGTLPSFEDIWQKNNPNRARFVSIFADLYVSRHYQEHAGQNGAVGIKNLLEYLPLDIIQEIKKRLGTDTLKNDDKTATNIEIREISKGSPQTETISAPDALLCELIAKQLGENRCTQLYDALFLAFNDLSHFEVNAAWSSNFFIKGNTYIATGISEINNLLKKLDTGTNNTLRMSKIFKIILARPEEDKTRTAATNTIYKFREILKPSSNNKDSFEQRFNKCVEECRALFKTTKREYVKNS